MNIIQQAAKQYVSRYGMTIAPLKPKSKLPAGGMSWQDGVLRNETAIDDWFKNHPQSNIGLLLEQGGFCSLDIDCMASFKLILEEFGMNFDDEFASYPTIQGASKGLRVMFRHDESLSLPYQKLNWKLKPEDLKPEDNPNKRYTVIELRSSMGKARQDVLPPSIHPDTQLPYKWTVQPPEHIDDWKAPPAWLIAMWQDWENFKPQLMDVCPWHEEKELSPQPKDRPYRPDNNDGLDIIGKYKSKHSIHDALHRYGYIRKGKRYLSPHSGTKLAGVQIIDNERCYIHHSSDPLCSVDTGQPVNAFDMLLYYTCNNNMSEAIKEAANDLGIDLKQERKEQKAKDYQREQARQSKADAGQEAPAHAIGGHLQRQFEPLGYDAGKNYFMPKATGQILCYSDKALDNKALMSIAPLEMWEAFYPKDGKGSTVEWERAVNDLMRASQTKGIFDHKKRRGVGAWYDENRMVLHLGDRLLCEDKTYKIGEFKSAYYYEKFVSVGNVFDAKPASLTTTQRLAEIFNMLHWQNELHGMMALGWAMLAPICGALEWKPHIWITAPRGAGKTWVLENIIYALVGDIAMKALGESTEAGIRQALKSHARPLVIDETEAESLRDQERIQNVITLARQASSETGAEVMKGTQSGGGLSFLIRSMFCLSSVNVSLKQAADESRFSICKLVTPPATDESRAQFDELKRLSGEILSIEGCASIRARSFQRIAQIRHNFEVFRRVCAKLLGGQREGDQMGALMTGWHLAISDEYLTEQAAFALLEGLNFEDATEQNEVRDEINCLNYIMQYQVRIDLAKGGSVGRTIGEVVSIAKGEGGAGEIAGGDEGANRLLQRYGLKIVKGKLAISNSHRGLKTILQNSPYGAGYKMLLERIDGAEKSAGVKFSGQVQRAILVNVQ